MPIRTFLRLSLTRAGSTQSTRASANCRTESQEVLYNTVTVHRLSPKHRIGGMVRHPCTTFEPPPNQKRPHCAALQRSSATARGKARGLVFRPQSKSRPPLGSSTAAASFAKRRGGRVSQVSGPPWKQPTTACLILDPSMHSARTRSTDSCWLP